MKDLSNRLDAVENYEADDEEMLYDPEDDENDSMELDFTDRNQDLEEDNELGVNSWMKDTADSLCFNLDEDDNENEMINQYEEEKETAPAVNQKLAEYVNKRFRSGIKEETMKKLMEEKKPLRPENCENLSVVRMNSAVFKAIPALAKKNDVKLQQITRTNIVGSIWLTQAVNEMLQLQQELQDKQMAKKLSEPLSKCNQVLNMMAQTHFKTNMFRKNAIRNVISPKYRDLCSETVPYTEELFGTDISKTVTELENQGKLSLKMGQRSQYRPQSTRSRPYFRGFRRPYNRYFERPYERQQSYYNDYYADNRRAPKNDGRYRRGRNPRKNQRSK